MLYVNRSVGYPRDSSRPWNRLFLFQPAIPQAVLVYLWSQSYGVRARNMISFPLTRIQVFTVKTEIDL